jgi:flagellar motor switch protein FliN/FliY
MANEQNPQESKPQASSPAGASFFSSISHSEVNFDTLLKVPVSLSIEEGRTKMTINDLLTTREGTVIELDRLMDEPLDILVNGSLIAHGVVVLANDRFGIQITDIVSRQERVLSI